MTRVLVCGGRNYANSTRVYAVLEAFDDMHGISAVIEGGYRGADALGKAWAEWRHKAVIQENAAWDTHGLAAGPIRNQKMVDDHKPDVVIWFGGGRGTHDMLTRAKAAGIPRFNGDDCAFTDADALVASWNFAPSTTRERAQQP